MLHLIGVMSGGNKPPLCKGRWLAKQDGGIVKATFVRKTIPQSPSASICLQIFSHLHKGAFGFVLTESSSVFPDKHCICGHKCDSSDMPRVRSA